MDGIGNGMEKELEKERKVSPHPSRRFRIVPRINQGAAPNESKNPRKEEKGKTPSQRRSKNEEITPTQEHIQEGKNSIAY